MEPGKLDLASNTIDHHAELVKANAVSDESGGHMSIKGESWESRIPGTQGYWQALFWKLTVFYIDWTQMLYMCLPASISVWQTAFQILELSLPAIHERLIGYSV